MKVSEYLPSIIPQKPGVYVFRDRLGKVIYVGKAVSLRRRLANYFQPARSSRADAKTRSLIHSIAEWDFQVVRSEEEALILESRLIKDYAPYYNILMRDDKRYPMLKINFRDAFPTLRMARVKKEDGASYFGPFPNSGALKSTLEFLLRHFKLRTCYDGHPDESTRKHCLKRMVKDCSAPCCGNVTEAEYRAQVEAAMSVLDGDLTELLTDLETQMRKEAERQRFEQAAKLRDVAANLTAVFGRKNRVFARPELPGSFVGPVGVESLQKALALPHPPDFIIGFDISNILGHLAVASLVAFRHGRPEKESYRRFRIKTVHQSDDFAMMSEAIRRHFGRLLAEKRPLPDLLMVDGGKGQLHAALDVLVEIGCPAFPIVGLAKREEELFIPGRSASIRLDRHDPGLRMLQALRDEAHRFAITYHRELRDKRLKESLLDDIPGIGPRRKKEILAEFGSVRALRKASAAEIASRVPGLGASLSTRIFTFFSEKKVKQKKAGYCHSVLGKAFAFSSGKRAERRPRG